jgi:uncharacterized protein (TIGR00255 family)
MRDLCGLRLSSEDPAMIKSMTGYGRREGTWAGGGLTVEIRAVNHRYLEVVTRVPRSLAAFEDHLKRVVQGRASRGRFEVTVTLSGEREADKTLTLNRPLARQYHKVLTELQRDLRLGGTVDLSVMAAFRDVITPSERPSDSGPLKQAVVRLLRGAVTDLDTMRRREGEALRRDLTERLKTVRAGVEAVAERAPAVVEEYFARMKTRIERLLGAEPVDQARLSQELAVYADRSDVTEEITRLRSHLEQFHAALASRKPVGRAMDFLLQEMGREVNTIGSKANDNEISTHVVQLKGELEKIREQVQNIE